MKRWLISIRALVYLALTTGFTVHMHYCMDELIGATLWHDHDGTHKCDNCGMERASGNDCCKDIHKVVKADDEHSPSSIADLIFFPVADINAPAKSWYLFQDTHPAVTKTTAKANAPPDRWPSSCPLYLTIQNLRI
jgi:hypothetical protein